MLNVLVDLSHDPRPKVRKAAWGSLLEICMVAFDTSGDDPMDNNLSEDEMEDGAVRMKKSLQSQRLALSKKIYTHSHSILQSKKRDEIKTFHTLRFLENAVEYCGDDTTTQFGQACLSLLQAAPSVDVIRQSLSTLQPILEQCGGEEMNKFACRSCAFLLQHRPSEPSLFTFYGRCLMGCVNHMVGSAEVEYSDKKIVATVQSKLLAFKLAPNVIRSMLHLCEGQEESCSEFNQLLSRITPILVECAYGNNSDDQLQRVSMETFPQCLPVLKEALQIQYRNGWGSLLSGGYSTFTSRLALALLSNGDDEALKSNVTSLVLSLLQLRQDVEKDGTARTAVEYATSTVIKGMGLELFMTCVDFVTEDSATNLQLQSSTTGGGIRDDRAWLLPLMKQSVPLFASESVMAVPVFAESATTKTHLSFFQGRVLNLARRCDAASADGHRTVAEASIQKARVIELWALLPAFCLYPVDIQENFPTLAKTVVKALGDYTRYPKLIVSETSMLFGLAVLYSHTLHRTPVMTAHHLWSAENFDYWRDATF
jgi:ribosomal RNA-processing protein 12